MRAAWHRYLPITHETIGCHWWYVRRIAVSHLSLHQQVADTTDKSRDLAFLPYSLKVGTWKGARYFRNILRHMMWIHALNPTWKIHLYMCFEASEIHNWKHAHINVSSDIGINLGPLWPLLLFNFLRRISRTVRGLIGKLYTWVTNLFVSSGLWTQSPAQRVKSYLKSFRRRVTWQAVCELHGRSLSCQRYVQMSNTSTLQCSQMASRTRLGIAHVTTYHTTKSLRAWPR